MYWGNGNVNSLKICVHNIRCHYIIVDKILCARISKLYQTKEKKFTLPLLNGWRVRQRDVRFFLPLENFHITLFIFCFNPLQCTLPHAVMSVSKAMSARVWICGDYFKFMSEAYNENEHQYLSTSSRKNNIDVSWVFFRLKIFATWTCEIQCFWCATDSGFSLLLSKYANGTNGMLD